VFPITSAAWDVLVRYQHQHARAAVYANDSESALEGKFLTNAARIALILHVVNLVEAGTKLFRCEPVPGNTMESACRMMEWFTNEGKRVYSFFAGDVVEGELTAEQREVMKVLKKHQPATMAKMKRYSREMQKWENPEEIVYELLSMGRIEREWGVGGAERFKIKKTATLVAAPRAEHGKYEESSNSNNSNTSENDFSTLSEFDDFSPPEVEESEGDLPILYCSKCKGEGVFKNADDGIQECECGAYEVWKAKKRGNTEKIAG
jgi:hypothetical protein